MTEDLATQRDYYEVLGLGREAEQTAIRDAFRQLALKYRPDRNREPDAIEHFREIAEAHAVLSDPARRAEYDARGHAGVAGLTAVDLFGGAETRDLFRGLGLELGNAGLLERIFGRRHAPGRGEDVELVISVPLERILIGGEERVRVARPADCRACHGSGAKAGTDPRTCGECGGSGQRVHGRHGAAVDLRGITVCGNCGGRGTIIDTPCPACGGAGRVVRDETLTVRIPRGAEEGTALRIPGHGRAAESPGLPPGDLCVIVRTAADPRFERRGRDLYRHETIDVVDAVLGAEIEVPTLDGKASITVPAGTQPNSMLRLRGEGLPGFSGAARGDMLVRIMVRVPEHLSDDERQLFERLRSAAAGHACGPGANDGV